MNKPVIVFISFNTPSPIIVRKLDLLYLDHEYEIHLVYLNRLNSMVDFPIDTKLPISNIHCISLPEPRGNPIRKLTIMLLWFYLATRKAVKLKPSAIHAVNMDTLLIAFFFSLYKNVKIVLDLLDTREITLHPFLRSFFSFALRKTDLIFITSPKFYSAYLSRINSTIRKEQVFFVPNVPSDLIFKNFKRKKTRDLVIGYFGFLRGRESIQSLIEIVKKLNGQGLQISILFAGIGIERSFIEEMARAFTFVKYEGSYHYNTAIKNLYKQIDIVYSIYDIDFNKQIALGCRFSEAILCEIPLLVTDRTFMGELVELYGNGYVIHYGQWHELEQLLKKLYTDRRDLAKKGAACRPLQKENSFEYYSPIITENYKKLIQS